MCAADGYTEMQKLPGYADSARLRRMLEYIMTEQQARLVVSLPASPEELAEKLGMDVEIVNSLLHDLHGNGVIIHKNLDPSQGFIAHSTLISLANWTTVISYATSTLPDLVGLYRDLLEEIGDYVWPLVAQLYIEREQPQLRVLPAYRSILDSPEILPEEDVRAILSQARTITVVPCICRVSRGPCRQSEANVCMGFNRLAEEMLSTNLGGSLRALSYEEALAIIDAAEEAGLIHRWQNSANMIGTDMCNCCSCCCGEPPLVNYGVPLSQIHAKSRYEARVDTNACVGCRNEPVPPCVAICPDRFAGAIAMTGTPGTPDFKAVVDPEKCYGCGLCVLKCPAEAIRMELVRPADHIPGMPMPRP